MAAVMLTACGGKDAQKTGAEKSAKGNANGGTTYPLTITHAFGETILENQPERIATIGWCNQDVPLALGIVPVGFSEANYGVSDGSGLLPWTADAIKAANSGTPRIFRDSTGLDYEAISESKPDVILASYSGITAEEYSLLSEIAPVVAYKDQPWQTFWREQTIMNAEGMGMRGRGEKLVADLEKLITEKAADYPALKGKSAGFLYFMPTDFSKFYVYLPRDPRAAYLTDLGMAHPESVKKLASAESGFASLVSAERVDEFSDIDVIVAYGDEKLLAAIKRDPLLGKLPAIRRESVAFIENDTALAASATPSALSIPANIDAYLKLIGSAAEKAR
jgi:iron complex transport system substrate-binding protein